MSSIQTTVRQSLEQAAGKFKNVDPVIADQLLRLADQVDQTCRVAVVGRMSAGKSSFINALLGEDKAVVGTNETTATINHFIYGEPKDPQKPIRCCWLNGQIEDYEEKFLERLQGKDVETLRLAAGIARLEYLLPNPFLRNTILVDTPGTGAVISEHQNMSAEYLGLCNQLRDRRDRETRDQGDKANAVIYLFDAIERASDRSLLEEYIQETQGQHRALNIIGVMAKIDRDPEIIARRDQLAGAIAGRLRDSVNTVLPVSALLHRLVLKSEKANGKLIEHIASQIRRVEPETLKRMLDNQDFYDTLECPLTDTERAELLREAGPWPVFTTVARLAANRELAPAEVTASLKTMSGFDHLVGVLREHFFERAHIIHGFSLVQAATKIMDDLRYRKLPKLRDCARQDSARKSSFLAYLDKAGGDRIVARDLAAFLEEAFASRGGNTAGVEQAMDEARRVLALAMSVLDNHNRDFGALQGLSRLGEDFLPEEADELRRLFGMYGMDTKDRLPLGKAKDVGYLAERQQYWTQQSLRARKPSRREIAEHAVTRYGLTIADAEKLRYTGGNG